MAPTWLGLPTPMVPAVALPGLALSQAISSCTLFAGSVFRPTSISGENANSATAAKSFFTSNGTG